NYQAVLAQPGVTAGSPQAIAAFNQYQAALQQSRTASQNLTQAQNQLNTATQNVAQSQQALNQVLAGFGPAARGPVLAASNQLQATKTLFDNATQYAEATGANIINQGLQVAQK